MVSHLNGITIKYVDLSMLGYVQSVLHKFQHHPLRRRQHAPHPSIKPTYGQKTTIRKRNSITSII